MTFAEKMRGIIDKGVDVSRDLAGKASDKAKDLGAMGVLKLEISQMESQAHRLMAKLGTEVYRTFVEGNQATISREAPSIRDFLKEIEGLRGRIDLKEREYQSISGKSK
jgi:hypothetical protein